MVWVTSDFHISHENIMKYCNRYSKEFKSIDNYIDGLFYYLSNLKSDDILIYLGDLACGPPKSIETCKKYFNFLKCELHFIRGNHDKWLSNDDILEIGFKSVRDYLRIDKTLMCHYPFDRPFIPMHSYAQHAYLWEKFFGTQNLNKIIHGHIHNSKVPSTEKVEYINTSVDRFKDCYTIYNFKDLDTDIMREVLNSNSSDFDTYAKFDKSNGVLENFLISNDFQTEIKIEKIEV